jgi:hypothetical protein
VATTLRAVGIIVKKQRGARPATGRWLQRFLMLLQRRLADERPFFFRENPPAASGFFLQSSQATR